MFTSERAQRQIQMSAAAPALGGGVCGVCSNFTHDQFAGQIVPADLQLNAKVNMMKCTVLRYPKQNMA